MKIRVVDRKKAVKKIAVTIAIVVVLLIVVNYYLNPFVEKQLEDTATRIALSQNYDKEKVLEALTATITSITDKLVYAYIIIVIIRTGIGLLDHKLVNLLTSRLLTIVYLAYTYVALNYGRIILDLQENIIVIDVSRLLTTTLFSITLVILGVTTIQAAYIVKHAKLSTKNIGYIEKRN